MTTSLNLLGQADTSMVFIVLYKQSRDGSEDPEATVSSVTAQRQHLRNKRSLSSFVHKRRLNIVFLQRLLLQGMNLFCSMMYDWENFTFSRNVKDNSCLLHVLCTGDSTKVLHRLISSAKETVNQIPKRPWLKLKFRIKRILIFNILLNVKVGYLCNNLEKELVKYRSFVRQKNINFPSIHFIQFVSDLRRE